MRKGEWVPRVFAMLNEKGPLKYFKVEVVCKECKHFVNFCKHFVNVNVQTSSDLYFNTFQKMKKQNYKSAIEISECT